MQINTKQMSLMLASLIFGTATVTVHAKSNNGLDTLKPQTQKLLNCYQGQ